MNIEQALAEALWGQGIEGWSVVIRDDVTDPTWRHRDLAAALASSPSMQAIARQAAIGAAVESYPDDRTFQVEQMYVFSQDDGAALRRLREALPDGYGFSFSHGRQWVVRVDDLDLVEEVGIWTGATIAEAADKCREALK